MGVFCATVPLGAVSVVGDLNPLILAFLAVVTVLPMLLAAALVRYVIWLLATLLGAAQRLVRLPLHEHPFAIGVGVFVLVAVPGGGVATLVGNLVDPADSFVSLAIVTAAVVVSISLIAVAASVAIITPLHTATLFRLSSLQASRRNGAWRYPKETSFAGVSLDGATVWPSVRCGIN